MGIIQKKNGYRFVCFCLFEVICLDLRLIVLTCFNVGELKKKVQCSRSSGYQKGSRE